jgi:autotransporter-associated beta strand protein
MITVGDGAVLGLGAYQLDSATQLIAGTGNAIAWSGSQAPALALSLTGPTGVNETKALIFGGITAGAFQIDSPDTTGSTKKQVALLGDNSALTSVITIGATNRLQVYAGAPGALGRGGVVLSRADLFVNAAVDMGNTTLTVGEVASSKVATHGMMALTPDGTRAVLRQDAILNLVTGDAATYGTLAAAKFTLKRGSIVNVGLTDSLVAGAVAGSIEKLLTSNFTLSSANTYSGLVEVKQGTLTISNSLALGKSDGTSAAGTVVSSGATLSLKGALSVGNERLTLNGIGVSGLGAFSSSATSSYAGEIALGGSSRIHTTVAKTLLSLDGKITGGSNNLELTGLGNFKISGQIASLGSLNVLGTTSVWLEAGQSAAVSSISLGSATHTFAKALYVDREVANTGGTTLWAGSLLGGTGTLSGQTWMKHNSALLIGGHATAAGGFASGGLTLGALRVEPNGASLAIGNVKLAGIASFRSPGTTGDLVVGSATVSQVLNPGLFAPGAYVYGSGIPVGTTVVSVDIPGKSLVLSNAATQAKTGGNLSQFSATDASPLKIQGAFDISSLGKRSLRLSWSNTKTDTKLAFGGLFNVIGHGQGILPADVFDAITLPTRNNIGLDQYKRSRYSLVNNPDKVQVWVENQLLKWRGAGGSNPNGSWNTSTGGTSFECFGSDWTDDASGTVYANGATTAFYSRTGTGAAEVAGDTVVFADMDTVPSGAITVTASTNVLPEAVFFTGDRDVFRINAASGMTSGFRTLEKSGRADLYLKLPSNSTTAISELLGGRTFIKSGGEFGTTSSVVNVEASTLALDPAETANAALTAHLVIGEGAVLQGQAPGFRLNLGGTTSAAASRVTLGGVAHRRLRVDGDVWINTPVSQETFTDIKTALEDGLIPVLDAPAVGIMEVAISAGSRLTFNNPTNTSAFGTKEDLLDEDNVVYGQSYQGEIRTTGAGTVVFTSAVDGAIAVGDAAGAVEFNVGATSARDYGNVLAGSGRLIKTGPGVLNLTGTNTLAGSAESRVEAGTLQVNGTWGGALRVLSGGTLGGSGVVKGNAFIEGTHAPGNSPGVQTFDADLAYAQGSSIRWELTDNTTAQATPAVFDVVNVAGNLSFAGSVTMNLVFGATVSWADPFWSSTQVWPAYVVAGSIAGTNSVLEVPGVDGLGTALATVRPGARFTLAPNGDLIYSLVAVADGNVTSVQVPATHVGVPFASTNVVVQNVAAAGSENLQASLSGSLTAVVVGPTSLSGITPGGSASLAVELGTPSVAGPVSRTGSVSFRSAGSDIALGSTSVNVSGVAYEYASPAYAGEIIVGKIRRNLGQFPQVAVSVANTAVSVSYGEYLDTSVLSTSGGAVVTGAVVGPLAPGASNAGLRVSLDSGLGAGIQVGQVNLSFESLALAGSGLGNSPLGAGFITVRGVVYEPAVPQVHPADLAVDLGYVRKGTPFAARTIRITNAAPTGSIYSESLSGSFLPSTPGVNATGTLSLLAPGAQDNSALTVNWASTATAGTKNGSTTIQFTTSGSGLAPEGVGQQVIQITGQVAELASFAGPTTVNSGRVHFGGTLSSVAVPVVNSTSALTESLDASVLSAELGLIHNAAVISSLLAGATSQVLTAQIVDNTTAGRLSRRLTLAGESVALVGGFANLAIPSHAIDVTGLIYTGRGAWLGGSGDWSTGSLEDHWSRWEELGGIPGRDGSLSVGDEATFAASAAQVVTLRGLSPELQGLRFHGAGGTGLIASASEKIILGKGVPLARIEATAGDNQLGPQVELHQNLEVVATSGSAVTFAGGIAGATPFALSMKGPSTNTMGGSINFSGAIGGAPALSLQTATMRLAVDQVLGVASLRSGAILSSKPGAGTVNLSFASLEKIAAGATYDSLSLGEASAPSKLTIGLSSPSSVELRSGFLYNNAVITAPVVVHSGGTLSGVGSSAGVSVASGGKLAPGNSIGAYSTASLTLDAGSTFNVEFNANNADLVNVLSGPTVLSGQLLLSYLAAGGAGDANVSTLTTQTIISTAGHTADGRARARPPGAAAAAAGGFHQASSRATRSRTRAGSAAARFFVSPGSAARSKSSRRPCSSGPGGCFRLYPSGRASTRGGAASQSMSFQVPWMQVREIRLRPGSAADTMLCV